MRGHETRRTASGGDSNIPSGIPDQTGIGRFSYRFNPLIPLLASMSVLLVSSCGNSAGKTKSNCEDIKCAAPAVCDDSKGEANCVCPEGYSDVNGDGSKCVQNGESDDAIEDCPANAVCTDVDGGFECAKGYIDVSGTCKANDATACGQDADCVNGHCVAGICCASACDDPPQCRTSRKATCSDGSTCIYLDEQDGKECDDGDPCTVDDNCVSGACVGVELDCDDNNPCTDDSCVPESGCVHENNSDSCDDGNACTVDDICEQGECVGNDERDCDDDNRCTDDGCDPETGCVYDNNHAPCDDGDACTSGDTCDDGVCESGYTRDCNDGNVCTYDDCDADRGCVHVDISASCNDKNVCTTDSCDSIAGCISENVAGECDDGNACTTNDACDDGECVGGEPPDCNDGNLCTEDSCDSETGCEHEDITASCDDGNACTEDSCDPESGCVYTGTPSTLKARCAYDEYETACSSIVTPTIPLSGGGSYGNIELQQGPYGSFIEWNEGEGTEFELVPDPLESGCTTFTATLGEPGSFMDDWLDLRGQDLGLYTVFRPACMKAEETYPVVTWGNGTCASTIMYAPLLATVASHGFVIFATNSRFTGDGTKMLSALDLAEALNADSDTIYYQKLDFTNVGAMGHSQGSIGAAAASVDLRIKALIFWNGATSSNDKPFMTFSGERDLISASPASLQTAVNSTSQPGAWLYYHQILETGGIATGHLTLLEQPDRVWEPAVAWWKYMLKNDQDAREMFIGDNCGLCNRDVEFEYGHNSLLN